MVTQYFYRLYSFYSYYEIMALVPELYNISSMLFYFICSHFYLLIPHSYLALPPSLSQLVTTSFFLCICKSTSVLLYMFIYFILGSTYKW